MADDVKSFGDLKTTLIKAKPTEPAAAAREQVKNNRDSKGRAYATGKRKNAVARVWIKPGPGRITINGREEKIYFARPASCWAASSPSGCWRRRSSACCRRKARWRASS